MSLRGLPAAGAAVVALSACSGQVLGLGNDEGALATVRVRIEGGLSVVQILDSAPKLRVGILWAGVPLFVPFCHQFGPTPLDPDREIEDVAALGCRDPFEVVPGLMGPSVPLEPDQREAEIPLTLLPSPEVLVGPPEARVGYGSLIVFDDLDGDGGLSLMSRCRRDGTTESQKLEPIYAASFWSLTRPQIRLVYLEGSLDPASTFYPQHCATLPAPGFSVWSVGSLLEEGSSCELFPIDHPIQLTPGYPPELSNLACEPRERTVFASPPRENPPSPNYEVIQCTEAGTMAVASKLCPCPEVRSYQLRGCYDEVDCEVPDWDVAPPSWWTCGEPQR